MKRGLCDWFYVLALPLLVAMQTSAASATPAALGDDHVIAAREAFRTGDRAKLQLNVRAVHGHDLQPYVEYWLLRQKLEEAGETNTAEITDFLARYPGTLIAERLRADWLKQLGKLRQWGLFEREYPLLTQQDQEVDCYALQSRLARQDSTALDEAWPLWPALTDLPAACVPVMDALVIDGRISTNQVWERVRRMLEMKKPGAAKLAVAYLPFDQTPSHKQIDSIMDAPQRHLDNLSANFAATKLGREMALIALARLARGDAQLASAKLEKIKARFSVTERGYVYAQLGWQGALQHDPQALEWFAAAGETALNEEQHAWRVRAALRVQDWRSVQAAIEAMPRELAGKPDWTYWLGRALQAQGRRDEAVALFQSIGGQPNFYSNLADEELGRSINVPPKASPPTPAELAAAAADPGIRRTLALFRLDMRTEAMHEWNWAMRGTDDRFLLAAAEIAQHNQIPDRAINAADRTQVQHDYSVRYLAPFRDQIEPAARGLNLDAGWVYGLMRQESRFVMNAKSSVGAAGLMQLMPQTAKWVANKIGLKNFHRSQVNDMGTNIALGTNYMKMVLDSLDNQPVLASAAYNAGPGRARKWRDASRPLEGAIYAETIPFSETRDYVKKVMCNSVYYSALFDGKPQSLKARLGVINASAGVSTARTEYLP